MKNPTKSTFRPAVLFLVLPVLLLAASAQADIATYDATLSGAQEVPAVATAAAGSGSLVIDTDTLEATWTLQFADLSGAQTGAHIHNAPAGANGGVVLALPNGTPVNGAWTLSAAEFAQLAAGNYYINVHTTTHPGGEIRGQLLLSSTVAAEDNTLAGVKALFR